MKQLFLLLILFFSLPSFAIELFQMGQSARSIGMGGTGIAFARGTDALFNNPAALARVNGFSLNIITFGPAVSANAADVSGVSGSGSFTAADVNKLYGKQIFSDITGHTGLVIPYVGVGGYSNNTMLMSFNNPSFPTFNVDFTSDYAYVVGGAIPITDNFSLGIAGRHVKRWQGNADILVSSLIGSNAQDVLEASLLNKGKGNALDLSALYTFKGSSWNVDVATVWKDVGDTKFNPTQGDGPDRQENNLMFGVAAQKELGFISWTNAFEYKFIRNSGDITKKLHLGTELSLALIDIRAGYNQGYLSYGLGVDLWFLQLDVAKYTSELGATAGQTPNDRYQASLSLNLDFDASFKLTNTNGKKRRLQQRR